MSQQSPQTILLVDDTPENIDLLAGMLGKTYRIKVATGGVRALELATGREPPDLILLDIMMPGMDGFEVCRRLKEDETCKDVPIIFISALDRTEDQVAAFAAGAVDYVPKPFQVEEVDARVATHLKLRALRLELEERNRQLRTNYGELRELEELRDNLVHMIVHDMRSPLTGMMCMLEMLRETVGDRLEACELTVLQTAIDSTDMLSEMVSITP